MHDKTIVVTRPKGDEAEFAEALHERGAHVIHEPMLEIFLRHDQRLAVERALRPEPDAVIITSRHGAQALAILTDVRDLPLICVGEATEREAQSQGFTRTTAGGGTAQALFDFIMGSYDPGSRFLYVSGSSVRTDLSAMLGDQGMQAARLVAYDALPVTALSDTLAEQLKRGRIHAVTFLSARTAEIFKELLAKSGLPETTQSVRAFALSDSVAAVLAGQHWQAVHTADEATLASLLECIDNVLGK